MFDCVYRWVMYVQRLLRQLESDFENSLLFEMIHYCGNPRSPIQDLM